MTKTDHFVAMTECHMMHPDLMQEISYYPQFAHWWASVDGVMRAWGGGRDLRAGMPEPRAHDLIKYMDQFGVDVCFALREPMMDISGGAACMSTNGFIIKEIAPYPERMYLECNVGPVLRRGVKNAIWELEYLVKEHNAKLCKVYQPEDDGPLNDRRMWPFYEKACELGIPLTVHTGMSYVGPQPSHHTLPLLLDQVCIDFPELTIIAYHMGWPYSEDLMGLAGKHPNLYLSLSGIIGWFVHSPFRGYHMIGSALQWVSDDKIVMGLDLAFDDMGKAVDYIRNLQMPERLQEEWGYKPITDETRAKILGLNLARLTKIEPRKRVPGAAKK